MLTDPIPSTEGAPVPQSIPVFLYLNKLLSQSWVSIYSLGLDTKPDTGSQDRSILPSYIICARTNYKHLILQSSHRVKYRLNLGNRTDKKHHDTWISNPEGKHLS